MTKRRVSTRSPKILAKVKLPSVSAKTENQHNYLRAMCEQEIVFGLGVAGSGKTYLAIGLACEHLMAGKIDHIILTRPVEEAGKGVGFLKGSLEDKLAPHLMAITEYLKLFLGASYQPFLDQGRIRILALEYLRGNTFNSSYIVVDEAQNCTESQLRMIITRLGSGSKIFISGDSSQNDLGKKSGLESVAYKLRHLDEVGIIRMEEQDIQRNGLIGKVLRALDN